MGKTPKTPVWSITTSSERPIRDISKDLTKAGLVDGEILEEIGVITGAADEKVAKKLRKVRGVVDVSVVPDVDVGPPDSPVTW